MAAVPPAATRRSRETVSRGRVSPVEKRRIVESGIGALQESTHPKVPGPFSWCGLKSIKQVAHRVIEWVDCDPFRSPATCR